jgi:cyclopropane-fatty-acyl-phospholipid synthase
MTPSSSETAAKKRVRSLLAIANIEIDGTDPWDIQVHDDRVYERVLRDGTLGFGESYMDGWWDSVSVDSLVDRLLRAKVDQKVGINVGLIWDVLRAKLFNLQSISRAFEVGEKHYDLGNDLFRAMLDPRMIYTCAYWKDADNLAQAQENKLDLICRKIHLQAGQTVLDIGCGWGGFAKFAAEKYGAHVTGITISKEQVELGQEVCKGLPVEIKLQDYRSMTGQFDHIISIGMFEHVGPKNYATYMDVAARCLKDDGLFLLHTIGQQLPVKAEPWIEKYIFPNGLLPTTSQITKAAEPHFVMEDWHNFGPYYDKTLMAWYQNFTDHWPELSKHYDERFRRMWTFYLLSCAGSFRARCIQLWQIVYSKNGLKGGYQSIR